MKVESKTAKEFQSVGLTHTKRGVLNAHADYLLEQKNFLSEFIFTHVEWFLSFKNVYEFIKACRLFSKGRFHLPLTISCMRMYTMLTKTKSTDSSRIQNHSCRNLGNRSITNKMI